MKFCLLAVEDEVSEIAARQMIESYSPLQVLECYGKKGFGYLKANISKFQQASRQRPYFVLTDLDQYPCATALKDQSNLGYWQIEKTSPTFWEFQFRNFR